MESNFMIEINCGCRQSQEQIAKAFFQVKDSIHKRLYYLWFTVYDLLIKLHIKKYRQKLKRTVM